MICNTRLPRNFAIEVFVAQEQYTAFEVECLWDANCFQDAAFLVPANATLLTAIQCCLKQVQHFAVFQHFVAVVERQHLACSTIVVEFLVQADARNAAADHFILRIATIQCQEHVGSSQLLFDAKALANSRRATDNQATHMACSRSVSDLIQHQESVADALLGFFACFCFHEHTLVIGAQCTTTALCFIAAWHNDVCAQGFTCCIQQSECILFQLHTLHHRSAFGVVDILDSDKATASSINISFDQRKHAADSLTTINAFNNADLDLGHLFTSLVCCGICIIRPNAYLTKLFLILLKASVAG